MKKFVLCKLCLVVFGALLAVQSVSAGNWNKGTESSIEVDSSIEIKWPKYFAVSVFDAPNCSIPSLTTNLDKKVFAAARQLADNSDIMPSSDSLTVIHRNISTPWKLILDASVIAQATDEKAAKEAIVSSLVLLAEKDVFLQGATSKGGCYAGGNKNSKCGAHSANHRAYGVAAILMAASNMRADLDPKQLKSIDEYSDRAYQKLLKPEISKHIGRRQTGFGEFGDHSITFLSYAAWKKDEKTLIATHQKFVKRVDSMFQEDGYIDNNSYRGVRGFFYHVLGTESAISAAILFDAFGFNTLGNEDIRSRFAKSLEKVNEGLLDYEKFKAKGFRGTNITKDPVDEIWQIHPLASNLHFIAKNWFSVELAYQPSGYLKASGASKLSGFDAKCFFYSNGKS